MARFKCEECGRGIGSFSFRKELYTLQDEDGDHNFCSPECCEIWQQRRREKWLKEQKASGKDLSEVSEDLILLHARKAKEHQELCDAYLYSDNEQTLKLIKKKARELAQLEMLMGKKPDEDDEDVEWENADEW